MEIGRDTSAILLAASPDLAMFEPPDRQQALLEEFLAAALDSGAFNVGYAYQSLAEFVLDNGDLPRASQLLEESYAHYNKFDHKGGPAAVSADLGRIALLQGDYALAASLFERSRNLWRAIGWERYSAFPTRMWGESPGIKAITQPQRVIIGNVTKYTSDILIDLEWPPHR